MLCANQQCRFKHQALPAVATPVASLHTYHTAFSVEELHSSRYSLKF